MSKNKTYTIDTFLMWDYVKLLDGDLSYFDNIGIDEEMITKLTADYVEFRKPDKVADVNRLVFEIDTNRHMLNVYENCIAVLAYADSEELRKILNNSPYRINLPMFEESQDYYMQIEDAYKKLSKLRLIIEKKTDELEALIKDAEATETDKERHADSYLKMVDTLEMWRSSQIDPYTLTMKRFAIMEQRYADYVKLQKQKDNEKKRK